MFDCDWSSDVCFPILLAATPNFRRRILAAGEMRELCTASPELHREAGQFAAKTGKIDWIIGVAGDAAQIVEGAVAAGLPRARAKFFAAPQEADRKSTRLNSSHSQISYAVFCLKKKKI